MRYKTILVHAGLGACAMSRARLAARLARVAGAHLVGAAPTGVSRFLPPAALHGHGDPLAERCHTLREEAAQALAHFARIAGEEGVLSSETRLVDDDVDGGLATQARYCDLVVVGQPDPTLFDPIMPADLPEHLLLTSGRPVLVVPDSGEHHDPGGEVLVAWDGSPGAMRAVAGALPLLKLARRVTVLGFGDALPPTGMPEEPCAALATWLRRHGVTARPARPRSPADIGKALLAEAADSGAGLLVMGAWGHSPLREALVDGVTATVLRWMPVPVLMAH